LDLLTYALTFPPNVTELTFSRIKCITYVGMKCLGNHTKLKILRLLGDVISVDSFDLNCIAGSFPQLEVFDMEHLRVGKWKLGNGAMPRLQRLVIYYCDWLDDLPNQLWSLSHLRKVHIINPSEQITHRLRNLEINNEIQLVLCVEDYNEKVSKTLKHWERSII